MLVSAFMKVIVAHRPNYGQEPNILYLEQVTGVTVRELKA